MLIFMQKAYLWRIVRHGSQIWTVLSPKPVVQSRQPFVLFLPDLVHWKPCPILLVWAIEVFWVNLIKSYPGQFLILMMMNNNDVYITWAQACVLGPVCLLTRDSDHRDEDKKCSQPLHFVLWLDLMISGTQGGHDGLKYWHQPVLVWPKKFQGLSEHCGPYLVSWALHQLRARAGIIELDFTVWKCSWGCVTCCYQGGSWHYHITSIPPRSPHPSNADHNPDHKTGESRTNNLGREDYYQTCGLSSRRKVSLKMGCIYIYLICTKFNKKKLAPLLYEKYV